MATTPQVRILFDRRKRATATVKGTVEIEVVSNGERLRLSTGVCVLRQQWKGGSVINHPKEAELNKKIREMYDDIFARLSTMVKSGISPREIKSNKSSYFREDLRQLWKLLDAFFKYNRSTDEDRKDLLVVGNFHIVFEAMIDDLISDTDIPTKLKYQNDDKIVDHIYLDRSLLGGENNIYFIGDSKYYKDAHDITGAPLYKQFTYARNAIQYNVQQLYLEEVVGAEKLKELLGDAYTEGMEVVDVKDITVPEGTEFPVTITFTVTGVTETSKVAVLHYDTTAKKWEKVESKAGNGTITATFTSLSPVAFVVDKNTVSSSSSTTAGSTSTSGTTSPKTGETNVMMWAGMVAVAALAGMAVTYRRRKDA